MSERDEFRTASVKVVVEIDGDQHLLGIRAFVFGADEQPEEIASRTLQAWDAARDKAERTLRLYGAEGVLSACLAVSPADTTEGTG